MVKQTKHGNKVRLHVDLEPTLVDMIEAQAEKLGLKRAALTRTLVKYGISNMDAALQQGDKPAYLFQE